MDDVVSSGLMLAVNYNIAVQLQDSSTEKTACTHRFLQFLVSDTRLNRSIEEAERHYGGHQILK